MKSYVTFRRHPFNEVVARTNEDRHPLQVVPYGRYGVGVWTGHPIEFFIVVGLIVIGLVGIPAWRWFLGAAVIGGSLLGYCLWRRHR